MRRIMLAAALAAGLAFAETRAGDAAADWRALLDRDSALEGTPDSKYRALESDIVAFAAAHKSGTEGLEARLWLLRNVRYVDQAERGTQATKLAADLLDSFADSDKLGEITSAAYFMTPEQREKTVARLAKVSPHDTLKAGALFTLAQIDLRSKKSAERTRGRERVTEVGEKYAALPYRLTTYGAMADALLRPHDAAALEIGEVAPEIVGTTRDGKPIRLSDFRGKVVVLDFWGFW